MAGAFCLLFVRVAAAQQWADPAFSFRRAVDVNWDSTAGGNSEIADVRFYSAGHCNPTGDDIRMTTESGAPVPFRVLMVGPDDSARVAFALQPNIRRYYVYFGSANPPPLPNLPDLQLTHGLLLETRHRIGGGMRNAPEIPRGWDRCGPVIGRDLVAGPFIAGNPFGDQIQTISKYTGSFTAPVSGNYTFYASIASHGAVFIDDQPPLNVPGGPADTRFNMTLALTRGPHQIVIYQLREGGDAHLSLAWKPPGQDTAMQIMGRDVFGVVSGGDPGPLESIHHRLTADFSTEYLGECFAADNYSHRIRFTAALAQGQDAAVQWDFGDGQTSAVPSVEHVFLTSGIYPIRLTIKIGSATDTQTTKINVTRGYDHPDQLQTDLPPVHSRIVATYDVNKMPMDWLPWAAELHQRAENDDAMLLVAKRILSEPDHPDTGLAWQSLQDVTEPMLSGNQADAIIDAWASVPADSDLQPRAAIYAARLLLWCKGDFQKAEAMLEPMSGKRDDNGFKQMYAQSLILDQKIEQGRRILSSLVVADDPRQAAISGAMSRTIEFYIARGDWGAGEDNWDQWDSRYPSVFLEGYSVLLRVKLMELHKAPGSNQAAAKIAEAFAEAVPTSAYSPTLLDTASKLLASIDPAKSKELHETLKQRYPEDPLSQN